MAKVKAHGCTHFRDLANYDNNTGEANRSDRFGRLYGDKLPPLFTNPKILEHIGAKDGPMDGGSDPDRTTSVAVGQVFFGQFVDHDITLDVSSSFDRVTTPGETSNARTPTLDLDCLYGGGPEATPHLYEPSGTFRGVKLITGAATPGAPFAEYDLPRVGDVALIGDPRNDENRIVSQIQLAMIRFHNKTCDELSAKYEGGELFEKAREHVTWTYQWCVVHDFLASICGHPVVDEILAGGRQHYAPNEPYIPVEFSVAGFRFGHSMVPMKVQTRTSRDPKALFGPTLGEGFTPIVHPEGACDMHELFETSEGRIVERASAMDSQLATDLFQLSGNIVGTSQKSLAIRNLERGQTFRLPSGETLAAEMCVDQADITRVSDAVRNDIPELTTGTPLWLYILKEAEIIGRARHNGAPQPGEGLGPLGARLVAEVIIGLIELDKRSWLGSNRNWTPAIETVGEMLAYAQPANLPDPSAGA